VRLADTQTVTAIAQMSDGSFWSTARSRGHALRLSRGRADLMARAVVTCPRRRSAARSSRSRRWPRTRWRRGFAARNSAKLIPRDIIRRFTCTYNGTEVCRVDLHPAMSANPLIAFTTVATESGTLSFQWVGDNGYTVTEIASIRVE